MIIFKANAFILNPKKKIYNHPLEKRKHSDVVSVNIFPKLPNTHQTHSIPFYFVQFLLETETIRFDACKTKTPLVKLRFRQ